MKKIKKVATSIGLSLGKILNSNSNSTENTYSCDYINKKFDGTESMGSIVAENIICKNIYDKVNYPLTLNRAINIENGTIYSSTSGNWYATEQYIPINKYANKNIISSSDNTSICFYDNNKSFISYISKKGKIPANACYMRFDTHKDYIANLYIELGTVLTGYTEYKDFSGKQIYSTKEQIIGTWEKEDGTKVPLYRKMIRGNTPTVATNGTTVNQNYNIGNDIELSFIEFGFVHVSGIGQTTVPYMSDNGNFVKAITNKNTLTVFANATTFGNRPFNISVLYIKD